MDRFIQRENLKHLRELLARTTEDAECRQIMKLIEEIEEIEVEEAKTPLQPSAGRA
jgi:hypothetical protein